VTSNDNIIVDSVLKPPSSLINDYGDKGVEEISSYLDEHTSSAEPDIVDNSYSLRELFQLPTSYLDANSDAMDIELVENYAEELRRVAHVNPAIAYGVALDTFLADPIGFRHRIGKLPIPQLLTINRLYVDADDKHHNSSQMSLCDEANDNAKSTNPVESTLTESTSDREIVHLLIDERVSDAVECHQSEIIDISSDTGPQAVDVGITYPEIDSKNTPSCDAVEPPQQIIEAATVTVVEEIVPPSANGADFSNGNAFVILQEQPKQTKRGRQKAVTIQSVVTSVDTAESSTAQDSKNIETQDVPVSAVEMATKRSGGKKKGVTKVVAEEKPSTSAELADTTIFESTSKCAQITSNPTQPMEVVAVQKRSGGRRNVVVEESTNSSAAAVVQNGHLESNPVAAIQPVEMAHVKQRGGGRKKAIVEEPVVAPESKMVEVVAKVDTVVEATAVAAETAPTKQRGGNRKKVEVIVPAINVETVSKVEAVVKVAPIKTAPLAQRRGARNREAANEVEVMHESSAGTKIVQANEAATVASKRSCSRKRGSAEVPAPVDPVDTKKTIETIVEKEPVPIKMRSCSRARGATAAPAAVDAPSAVVAAPVARRGRGAAVIEAAPVPVVVVEVKTATVFEAKRSNRRVAEVVAPLPVISVPQNEATPIDIHAAIAGKKSTRKRDLDLEKETNEKPLAAKRSKRDNTSSMVKEVKTVSPAEVVVIEDDEEEALVIICDKCDVEFFVDEIGLSAIPEGDWFCETCAVKPAAGRKRKAGK